MGKESKNVLVSACIVGIKCRYDSKSSISGKFTIAEGEYIIPVCPEQLGGLPTPREAAEIVGGEGQDVLHEKASVKGIKSGQDYTENFIRGAEETLKIAQICGCQKAYLKAKSPSCGWGRIYHNGVLTPGNGVTAALLQNQGIEIIPI